VKSSYADLGLGMGVAVEPWSWDNASLTRFEDNSGSIGGVGQARSRIRSEVSIAGRRDAGQRAEGEVNKIKTMHAAAAHAPGLGSGGVLRGRAVAEAGPGEGLMHGRAEAVDPLAGRGGMWMFLMMLEQINNDPTRRPA
jgi:hypothetical protein